MSELPKTSSQKYDKEYYIDLEKEADERSVDKTQTMMAQTGNARGLELLIASEKERTLSKMASKVIEAYTKLFSLFRKESTKSDTIKAIETRIQANAAHVEADYQLLRLLNAMKTAVAAWSAVQAEITAMYNMEERKREADKTAERAAMLAYEAAVEAVERARALAVKAKAEAEAEMVNADKVAVTDEVRIAVANVELAAIKVAEARAIAEEASEFAEKPLPDWESGEEREAKAKADMAKRRNLERERTLEAGRPKTQVSFNVGGRNTKKYYGRRNKRKTKHYKKKTKRYTKKRNNYY